MAPPPLWRRRGAPPSASCSHSQLRPRDLVALRVASTSRSGSHSTGPSSGRWRSWTPVPAPTTPGPATGIAVRPPGRRPNRSRTALSRTLSTRTVTRINRGSRMQTLD
ncbi:hypothetical protein OPV22_014355 [Ensete ventricosum]|uniref:Uncharacterized protein n=1 Tax=Ensete ventricosum TaxID=4639 RepID=A0AAV8PQ15_ENSVE|nr:hypothetical protein OPV22_014355 [Ensete ventricosum]